MAFLWHHVAVFRTRHQDAMVKISPISGKRSLYATTILEQLRNAIGPKNGAWLRLTWFGNNHTDRKSSILYQKKTRRPASADRTARRQFYTGQPVSRTQASDAMTSRLPRYEAKCVQRRCFQCGSVPLRSDIKGTELPPANILIPLERQLIALQLCRWQFLYNVDFCIG